MPKVKGLKELTLLVKQQKVRADMADRGNHLLKKLSAMSAHFYQKLIIIATGYDNSIL
jgi:hypothetical protein